MKAKKYANGGPVDPKKKKTAVEAKQDVSRAQQIEREKLVRTRGAEDRASAERLRADVRLEVGPGKGRPSGNTGNVTLNQAKAAYITKSGGRPYEGPGRSYYSRGELADQLSGKKMQPVYKSGETMGYATKREISSGPGFTAGYDSRDIPSSKASVKKSVTSAPVARKPGELSAATKAAIEKGKGRISPSEPVLPNRKTYGKGGMMPKRK